MLPAFLVPETTITANGSSPILQIEGGEASRILVTLGITEVVEQELLDLSIWDSPDGHTWGSHPIAAFPQKFYGGHWAILLDLARHPEARYLQARWATMRWGRGDHTPRFTFFVFAEEF
jgi:hypothetical protein